MGDEGGIRKGHGSFLFSPRTRRGQIGSHAKGMFYQFPSDHIVEINVYMVPLGNVLDDLNLFSKGSGRERSGDQPINEVMVSGQLMKEGAKGRTMNGYVGGGGLSKYIIDVTHHHQ